jgi:hypothetical protein
MGKKQGSSAGNKSRGKGGEEMEVAMNATEHLTRDLARVRAKFGLDPALAPRSLEGAWMSEAAVEEDEAEFVDTVADCVGAGLSLDDALTCWDSGDLASESADDSAAADAEDDSVVPVVQPVSRTLSSGHRLLIR